MMMMPWEQDQDKKSWIRKSASGKVLARLNFNDGSFRKSWSVSVHGCFTTAGMLRPAKTIADQRLQALGYQNIPPNMMALL